MPPDVADVAEVTQELAHDRLRLSAVRALEVAVLDHRDRRLERPTNVVALRVDVDVEIDERLSRAQQRANPEAARKQRRRTEEQPGEERRAEGGAQDAELRLLELRPLERERRDEQRDGEANSGDRAAACHGRPAHRRPEPSAAQSREQPRAPEDAHGLADDVANEDPERDRRGEGSLEEGAVDRDAGVREREQRHDQVARPRVVEQLQPLVRRDRGPEPEADGAGELGGRLLAELAEALRRTLEIGPRDRVGVGEKAHRESDDDRFHARLEQRDPDRRPEREVDEPDPHPERLRDEDDAEQPDGHEQRGNGDLVRVDEGDDDEREDVVDDDDREHERAQPVGKPRPDEREQTEGERGVGRHRDTPAVHG